jgi:hypothetical protein
MEFNYVVGEINDTSERLRVTIRQLVTLGRAQILTCVHRVLQQKGYQNKDTGEA